MAANELVLVAGPPCSGKSFVVDRLRSGALPGLEHVLLGDQLRDWSFAYSGNLALAPEPHEGRFVVQYDFLKQWKRDPLTWCYNADPSLRRLRSAERGVIVTVYEPMSVLVARARERRRRLLTGAITHPRLLTRHWHEICETRHLIKLYAMVDTFALYHRWFEFSSAHCAQHWVLEYDGNNWTLCDANEWQGRHLVP